ncbi:voltage-dependent T-type calcium channel subunit alpha-1H isoform X1 [Arapaima gigas]
MGKRSGAKQLENLSYPSLDSRVQLDLSSKPGPTPVGVRRWTARKAYCVSGGICQVCAGSKGSAYGNSSHLHCKGPVASGAIMTDGEGTEPFHVLESEVVRVPISTECQEDEGPSAATPALETSNWSNPGAGGPAPDSVSEEDEEQAPYPGLAPVVFFCLKQTSRPRSWCLRLVCNPYPSLDHTLSHTVLWSRVMLR